MTAADGLQGLDDVGASNRLLGPRGPQDVVNRQHPDHDAPEADDGNRDDGCHEHKLAPFAQPQGVKIYYPGLV